VGTGEGGGRAVCAGDRGLSWEGAPSGSWKTDLGNGKYVSSRGLDRNIKRPQRAKLELKECSSPEGVGSEKGKSKKRDSLNTKRETGTRAGHRRDGKFSSAEAGVKRGPWNLTAEIQKKKMKAHADEGLRPRVGPREENRLTMRPTTTLGSKGWGGNIHEVNTVGPEESSGGGEKRMSRGNERVNTVKRVELRGGNRTKKGTNRATERSWNTRGWERGVRGTGVGPTLVGDQQKKDISKLQVGAEGRECHRSSKGEGHQRERVVPQCRNEKRKE